ncbi:MAG: hypothetical protein H6707_08295 [Deltaproteobacteria bacterium]|nr:hypothetical protein [Deltaproteobacteria bacterium]
MRRLLNTAFAPLLLSVFIAACASGPPAQDGLFDGGASRDAVMPPDLVANDAQQSGIVGAPCDVQSGAGCTAPAFCLDVGIGVGQCVISGCSMENLETPAREDTCPKATACARIPTQDQQGRGHTNVCLPTCTVDPTRNSCANSQLACDPRSILFTGYAEVCLFAACTSSADCGNQSPLSPDSRCDARSGVCFVLGDPQASVGAPCKISSDCGPAQICLTEQRAGYSVSIAGGYCSVVGCKYKGPYVCPSGSDCFALGATRDVSVCLQTGCDPAQPEASDACRDEAPAGQYRCVGVGSEGVCWVNM